MKNFLFGIMTSLLLVPGLTACAQDNLEELSDPGRNVRIPSADQSTAARVQLTDFKQPSQPLGWAALTEFEVYGKDATTP